MAAVLKPRFRVTRGSTIVLGPGKADLLEAIRDTGSLRAAAASLGMSYMRAWSLVKTMNAAFKQPLVDQHRGGAEHGTTTLTKSGERVLRLYREMERRSGKATAALWARLEKELK